MGKAGWGWGGTVGADGNGDWGKAGLKPGKSRRDVSRGSYGRKSAKKGETGKIPFCHKRNYL